MPTDCRNLTGVDWIGCETKKILSGAKYIILLGSVIGIVFLIFTGLDWGSAAFGAWYNAPWISGVDPNLLEWYHWFDVDGTPYSYALYFYNPDLWWSITNIVNLILSIVIVIGGSIYIAMQ